MPSKTLQPRCLTLLLLLLSSIAAQAINTPSKEKQEAATNFQTPGSNNAEIYSGGSAGNNFHLSEGDLVDGGTFEGKPLDSNLDDTLSNVWGNVVEGTGDAADKLKDWLQGGGDLKDDLEDALSGSVRLGCNTVTLVMSALGLYLVVGMQVML